MGVGKRHAYSTLLGLKELAWTCHWINENPRASEPKGKLKKFKLSLSYTWGNEGICRMSEEMAPHLLGLSLVRFLLFFGHHQYNRGHRIRESIVLKEEDIIKKSREVSLIEQWSVYQNGQQEGCVPWELYERTTAGRKGKSQERF